MASERKRFYRTESKKQRIYKGFLPSEKVGRSLSRPLMEQRREPFGSIIVLFSDQTVFPLNTGKTTQPAFPPRYACLSSHAAYLRKQLDRVTILK